MSDPVRDVLKASPGQVAAVMELGHAPARVWRPEELAAVFRHQMTAAVSVDLGAFGPGAAARLKTLAQADNLLLRSFRDLMRALSS